MHGELVCGWMAGRMDGKKDCTPTNGVAEANTAI